MTINFEAIILTNSIGLSLLLIVLSSLRKKLKNGLIDYKLFFFIIISNIIATIFEVLAFWIDGKTFKGAIFLNYLSNTILFAINPIPPFLWSLFTIYKITQSVDVLKKKAFPLLIPIFIMIIFLLLNWFLNYVFTVDENNIYKRNYLFFIIYLFSYFYLVYSTVLIIKNKKLMKKGSFWPMISFLIPPIIGSIIQYYKYGISLIYVCISISIVIVYIYVQNDTMITDSLTGLFNRRFMENYVLNETKRLKEGDLLCGVMLDVDNFKAINDKFGHMTGDDALENVGLILKRCIAYTDVVARYAGDEFVIITKIKEEEDICKLFEKIEASTKYFNAFDDKPYKISFSYGYSIYNNDTGIDYMFKSMDKNMYVMKNQKKAYEYK